LIESARTASTANQSLEWKTHGYKAPYTDRVWRHRNKLMEIKVYIFHVWTTC